MSETTETMASESTQEAQEIEAVVIIPPERLPACKEEDLTDEVIRRVLGYKGAIMASPDDKAGYNKIVGYHKDGKNVLAKIKAACKKGREPAIKEQKDWIAFENDLVEKIEPILDDLEKQRKIYEAAEAKRKAEEQQKALLKVQTRLDSLSAMGRRPDYAKASALTDEEWEVYFASEKAEWEKENAQRAAAEQKRQIGELRKAELSQYNVPVVAAEVAELPEDDYQRILADAKKEFEDAQETQRLANERKRFLDERYNKRVAMLTQISIAMEPADIESVRLMEDEEWDGYYADEKELYDERQREAAENTRLDNQLRDRLQAVAGYVARAITPEEAASIRAMGSEDWAGFLDRVKTAHEQKVAAEAEAKRQDDLQRERMTLLMPFGIMVNVDLANRLRVMTPEEWDAYFQGEKTAHEERQAELARQLEAKAQTPEPRRVLVSLGGSTANAIPAPLNLAAQLADASEAMENDPAQTLEVVSPAPVVCASTADDLALVQDWVDLLDQAARSAPKHPDPNIQAGIDGIQKAVLAALGSYWYTTPNTEEIL